MTYLQLQPTNTLGIAAPFSSAHGVVQQVQTLYMPMLASHFWPYVFPMQTTQGVLHLYSVLHIATWPRYALLFATPSSLEKPQAPKHLCPTWYANNCVRRGTQSASHHSHPWVWPTPDSHHQNRQGLSKTIIHITCIYKLSKRLSKSSSMIINTYLCTRGSNSTNIITCSSFWVKHSILLRKVARRTP